MTARIRTRTKILLIFVISLGLVDLALWDRHRIERDFNNTMNFLRYARLLSFYKNTAHAVIFEEKSATLKEISTGKTIEYLNIETLKNVNYDTKQGKNQIIFNNRGMTDSYNVHEHGGGLKFKSWFGFKRGIWVHCTGLARKHEMH